MDLKQIEQMAAELGKQDAERSDPDLTAHAVLARLRAEAMRKPWWRRVGVYRLAAAAVVAIGAGIGVWSVLPLGEPGARVLPTPAEIEDLAVSELGLVLDSLEVVGPVHELVNASLEDLNEVELRQLLDTMEG